MNNFVHQDIHSGNVFTALVKDELIPDDKDAMLFKLGDMGVAKMVSDAPSAEASRIAALLDRWSRQLERNA